MTTTLGPRGQIVIPQELREQLQLERGDDFVIAGAGSRIVLEKIQRTRRARLVRRKGELPTFIAPKGSAPLTMEQVKALEEQMWIDQ
jgi:AbrB family looped-hinge helix DNA binding protein